jgi:release factor glutamine methyltransferase
LKIENLKFKEKGSMTTTETEWSIGRLLNWTSEYFKSKGLEEPLLSAQLLLAKVLGCSKVDLYLRFDQIVDAAKREEFRNLVKRAAEHEPIAYLIGYKDFFSLSFQVSPAVLIPRPETELLVQWLIRKVRGGYVGRGETLKILDIGTGSGCIAVAIAKNLSKPSEIIAVDRSKEALEVARVNIEKHGVGEKVILKESDLFSAIGEGERFDFIVSNPPYVTPEDYAALPKHIQDYEPRGALEAEKGGLAVIEKIVMQGGKYLEPGGFLAMEIGYNQKELVAQLLESNGYTDVAFELDAADIARIAIGRTKE